DQSAAVKVLSLYLGVTAPTVVTDPASAETIKYAANAFLATKLSFVNAIAAVCEGVGADVDDVILGLGYDTRIGSEFLKPGPGWGGSCFPKDTRALVRIAEQGGYDFRLLDGVIAVNEEQFSRIANKVRDAVGGDLAGRTVGVWGLTFKAGTDDLRESPALSVIQRLTSADASVCAYDPTVNAVGDLPAGYETLDLADNALSACDGADVLVVLTEWNEFRALDLGQAAAVMKGSALLDLRNVYQPRLAAEAGLSYRGVGRQPAR
ncbi:MAG: nucleotide sugar dehydrogenase, partial [Pseudomonadota bacterium]|nr:nucleotide sugar dehydrogenase [Pseudomonadota bacterium]